MIIELWKINSILRWFGLVLVINYGPPEPTKLELMRWKSYLKRCNEQTSKDLQDPVRKTGNSSSDAEAESLK